MGLKSTGGQDVRTIFHPPIYGSGARISDRQPAISDVDLVAGWGRFG